MIDPLKALLNQREAVLRTYDRLQVLRAGVGSPVDLANLDWILFYALAMEMKPDVIVELGRGFGNSTCAFTQAANDLGGGTRVVSVDRDLGHTWLTRTVPRLRGKVPATWFEPLEVLQGDIVDFNARRLFGDAKSVLLLWDAHGDRVGAHVLGELLPHLVDKEHMVVLHDVTDARWQQTSTAYGGGEAATYWQGHFVCSFREIYAAFDFLSRNHIDILTPAQAAESVRTESFHSLEIIYSKALGLELDDRIASGGHWLGFDLRERNETLPLEFPDPPRSTPLSWTLGRTLRVPAIDRLVTWFSKKRASLRA